MHTPPDGLRSATSAETLVHIIEANQTYLDQQGSTLTVERDRPVKKTPDRMY